MNEIMSELSLRNSLDDSIKPIIITDVPINLSSVHLNITQDIYERLQLKQVDERTIVNEVGKRIIVPYVGPIRIMYKDEVCYTGAIVTGGLIIGTIVLNDLNITIFPNTNTLRLNTE